MAEILYTDSYLKRAKKFIKKHPDLLSQYEKTLKILEINPYHPSLRLHRLQGKLSELYSVSINISYRISIIFLIKDDKVIPIDLGSHSEFIKIKNELEDYEDLKLLRQAKRKEADSPTLSMDEAKARLLTKRVVKQLKKRG